MPIPKPNTGEKEADFMKRCMEFLSEENRPQNQKVAICIDTWRKGKMNQYIYFALSDRLTELTFIYTGKFNHGSYGEFKVNNDTLKHILSNYIKGVGTLKDQEGSVLPVNYNHPNPDESDPERIKNAGFIRGMSLKGNEIKVTVDWTDEAKDRIKKKEFLWISPEFSEDYEDENGKKHGPTALGMALTNIPFLKKGQVAIALNDNTTILSYTNVSNSKPEDISMDEKLLREALGIDEKADILETIKELKKYQEDNEEKVTELTESKEVLEKENEDLEKQLKESKKSTDGKVTLTEEEHKLLKEGAEAGIEAQKKLALKEAEELVDSYIECDAPKFLPKQRDYLIKQALHDSKAFKEYADNASPVLSLDEKGSGGDKETLSDTEVLTKEIEKVAKEKKVSFTEARDQLKEEKPELFKE